MKKIILGKGLEERIADCNFCGETAKDCVRGDLRIKVKYPQATEKSEQVIRGGRPRLALFGDKYIIDDFVWENVIKSWEIKTEEFSADICKDCIKQLAKLI